MKPLWIITFLIILAGSTGYFVIARDKNDTAAAEPETIIVESGTVERNVLASGVIEAGNLVSVGARVSGLLESLSVDLGSVVKKGDMIAQIESLDQQNQVLQAEAELAQIDAQIAALQASLRQADLDMTRKRQLNEKSLTSTSDLETAQSALDVARANLTAMEAQRARADVAVKSAHLALERTQITAPIAGTVVAVVTLQGQSVNANNTSPTIVKIADLTHMVVKADVSEADITRVKPGQKATLTLIGEPDVPIEATLAGIEPAPAILATSDTIETDKAVYYVALFDVANPDGKLRIGMTTEVKINLARATDVPMVLNSALGSPAADGSYAVDVWNPVTKTREPRKVTIGVSDNVTAEVTSGLKMGDRVVADRTSGNSAAAKLRGMPGIF